MNKKALRVGDYLAHILDAVGRIRRYVGDRSRADFLADEQLQDAIIRNLEVIGEAAHNIVQHAPAFAAEHDEVPWPALYAMRNRISYGSGRSIWISCGRWWSETSSPWSANYTRS